MSEEKNTTPVKASTEIGDLAGHGKIVESVIGLLERVGLAFFKKGLAKRDTDARNYDKIEVAKTDIEIYKLRLNAIKEIHPEVVVSIDGTVDFENGLESIKPIVQFQNNEKIKDVSLEERRELNAASVAVQAIAVLVNEQHDISDSKETVSDDWTARFIRITEDVSDADMQVLWARILAGEVKKPRSFSLRTLDVLKNMSKKEAEVFLKIAPYVLEWTDVKFVFCNLMPVIFPHENFTTLIECGILQSHDLSYKLLSNRGTFSEYRKMNYQKEHVLHIEDSLIGDLHDLRIAKLTVAGKELINLLDVKPSLEYLKRISNAYGKDDKCIRIYKKMDANRLVELQEFSRGSRFKSGPRNNNI